MAAELLFGLWVIFTLVFLAAEAASVDPARALLGPAASEDAARALRHELGLDRPALERYGRSLVRTLRGDFGVSYDFRLPVRDLVRDLLPSTLGRAAVGLIFGGAVGLAGALVAARAGFVKFRWVLTALQAAPSFCLLVLGLWAGARGLGITPLQQRWAFEALAIIIIAAYPAGAAGSFALERASLVTPYSPHVDFLFLLGAPRHAIVSVLWTEALPGSCLIIINSLGVAVTGASLAELIFGLEGFGRYFFRACARGDLPIVSIGTVILAVVVLTLQRVGDVAIRAIDPRVSGVHNR